MEQDDNAFNQKTEGPVELNNSLGTPPTEPIKDNKKRKIIIAISVIFAVALITFGAWFVYASNSKTDDAIVVIDNVVLNEQRINYAAVDTNQTNCYGNDSQITCPELGQEYYGQDAQYTNNAPSYADNGDGTVTDNVTGLMWQKTPGEKTTYSQATEAAESFSLAGHDDWRTPTIKELYSLMDFSGQDIDPTSTSTSGLNPFIDSDVFDFEYGDTSSGSRIIDSQWVTSNKYVSKVMNNQECFFGVNFADGRIKCYPTVSMKNQGYFVRYVRGEPYGQNNFEDNKDGTISDAKTGLVWQKTDSGQGLIWKDSLAYCEDLALADSSDWRLPNAKELQSIVDYERSPDTTDSPAIDPIFSTTSITNEANAKDWPFFWTSTSHLDAKGADSAVYVSFGRAMGNMTEFGGWIDVHGAGAQRSDPKSGNPESFSQGRGPQGDAIRINNFVRCISGSSS